jgi:integrase
MAWITKRTTASGEARYHVEYRTPDGARRSRTFRRRKDAEAFHRTVETDISDGGWIDPNAGKVTLSAYSKSWLGARKSLSPRTRELYEGQLRLHILPMLGEVAINRLTPGLVREWNASLYEKTGRRGAQLSPNTIAKCYRLLHVICATAVEDELLRRNPCRIRNAGKEEHDERPTATAVEVVALSELVRPQRRLLVLLAGFSGLRLGELLALRRRHVDALHRRLLVRESTIELGHGELVTKGPKSQAGKRDVHLDPFVFEAVRVHLDQHTAADPDGYLFTGDHGGLLRRAVWHAEWDEARRTLSLKHLRFHDLRHTHGTMTAQSGATIKETMRRLGHSTIQAAMHYQHATDERDSDIAEALGERIAEELRKAAEQLRKVQGQGETGEGSAEGAG